MTLLSFIQKKLSKNEKVEKTPQRKPRFPYNAPGMKKNHIQTGKHISSRGDCAIEFWRDSCENQIIIGDNFQAVNLKITFKGRNSKLIIGNNVKWSGYILIVGDNREVIIGDNSTSGSTYILSRHANVYIGQDCMLSREIEIRSSDVHKIYDINTNKRINHASDVIIEDNVWIAARSIISKGSVVPKGSVIGAASFVNKAFDEENCVLAGSPAKIVKRNIRWER